MFLSLPVLPCGTCTDYIDLCLLLADYILSLFLPLPITLIPKFFLVLALITTILCTKSLRMAAKARARRESALLNRTLRTYPRQAQSERMSFRLDTAGGYTGENMDGVPKAYTTSSSERTRIYEALSDTYH